jgi:hypothetical protein
MPLPVIFFILVLVLIIGCAIWWHNIGGGKQQREQAEREAAKRGTWVSLQGWRYEKPETGDIKSRIHGTTESGTQWVIEYDSDHGSSSSNPKLIFRADSLASTKWQWAITDQKMFAFTQKRAVKWLVTGLKSIIPRSGNNDAGTHFFFDKGRALRSGSSGFQARYVVSAVESKWLNLIDDDIERMILTWPEYKPRMSIPDNNFSAQLSPEGLRVQLFADSPSQNVIMQMAQLGKRLTMRSQGTMQF